MIDRTVVIAALSGVFGLLVATVPNWLAAKMKRRENGTLAARNLQLKQLDVEAEARLSLWENQIQEMERLRDCVESQQFQIDELREAMGEVDIRVSELHAEILKPEHSASALAALAVEILHTVRRGRAIGGAA